jgi:hypothetical protein
MRNRFTVLLALSAIALTATQSLALSEHECLTAYTNEASRGSLAHYSGSGAQIVSLGATSAASAGIVAAPVTAGVVIGTTTVATVAENVENQAILAALLVGTINELRARVLGPSVAALTNKINEIVFERGPFAKSPEGVRIQVGNSNPLSDSTRAQYQALLGSELKADVVAGVIGQTIAAGNLCPAGSTMNFESLTAMIASGAALHRK